MIFYIQKIHLWFKNESKSRELVFLPNKVNVITGVKSTGKSSILSIIDYCLLATDHRLIEEIINENTAWYGISFVINDKSFFIARKHPLGRIGSKDVHFSSVGDVPSLPTSNIDIKKIKSALELEFGIDEKLVIPYGGNKLVAGSKISYRYFLLFNTLSEDTIANSSTYFDFHLHDKDKYIEALHRIFFLAIGVDGPQNVLIKERLNNLEAEIDKLEKKQKAFDKEARLFNEEIFKLMVRAQEYDLIERKLFTHEEAYQQLKTLVETFKPSSYSNSLQQVEELNKTKRSLYRRIRNLERYDEEYKQYKENLNIEYDSIKPVVYLNRNFGHLIPTLEVKQFIDVLESSLAALKASIGNKKSITVSVKSQIAELQKQLLQVDRELSNLPTSTRAFTDEVGKYIYIGEIKSKLAFYEDKWNTSEEFTDVGKTSEELHQLKIQLKDTEESKKVVLQILTEKIQEYFDQSKSMGVYAGYKVHFDEALKILKLRKPTELLPRNIGSKSNYMFLHLFLFLGFHDHIMSQGGKYVPQFLILDQPSQPYLDKKDINSSGKVKGDDDRAAIKDAFKLLNDFLSSVKKKKQIFQIFLLEHASKDYWEDPLLKNFHLVEEFRDGNALIPTTAIGSQDKSIQQGNDSPKSSGADDKLGGSGKQTDLFGNDVK